MNLYYIVLAIIAILLVFPALRATVFNSILPSCFNHQVISITPSRKLKNDKSKKNNKDNNNYDIEGFNNKKIVFTAYTADWCPHCVTFKSDVYGNLVSAFANNPNIKIKNVDCTNDQSGKTTTPAGNPLQGFPTLVINIYKDGKMTEKNYDGPRDSGEIINYLNNL
jgi:thiol:disulfide interchange protein